MKRGMSSIVSTLLIILLVFALSGTAIVLVNSSLFKTQQQATIDKYCSAVDIVVGDFCYENVSMDNARTGVITSKEHIVFSVENDMNTPLTGLLLSLQYNNGNKVPLAVLGGGTVNASKVVKLTTDFINGPLGIDSLQIMPEVKVGNETVACDGNAQIFKWGNISKC